MGRTEAARVREALVRVNVEFGPTAEVVDKLVAGKIQGDGAGSASVTVPVQLVQVKFDNRPVGLEPQHLVFVIILCVVCRPTRLETASLTEVQVNTV